MRTLNYIVFTCSTCGVEAKMCISGMPLSGLCTKCRKKKWRTDNPEPKQAPKYCSQCGLKIGKNNNSLLCRTCHKILQNESIKTYNNEYAKVRYASDPCFRIAKLLRSRLSHAIRENRVSKTASAVRDLGCSLEDFKTYFESKFKLGMTWNNYGKWEIDHIDPLASFDLEDPEQQKRACRYTNLQPIWKEDHIKKTARDIKIIKENQLLT
jgi:hypothetical protein